MKPASKPEPHPLRGVTAEWLPAPSLETLARERLLVLLLGLAGLHVLLAMAHVLDVAEWDFTQPRTFFQQLNWTDATAVSAALATAVFIALLRVLLPKLPSRWSHPLSALIATLVVLNALGLFALRMNPPMTVMLIFAVLGASFLFFCTRTLLLVFAVAIGGWVGIARADGFGHEWWPFGAALLASCCLGVVFQRLQISSIKQMLRGVAAETTKPAELDNRAQAAEDDERFRRWYEATFEGIALHEKGVVLEANKALASLLDCDLAKLPGQNLLDWFTRSSRHLIEESILLGNFRPFEAVARRPDKSEVHLELFSKKIPYRGREVMVTAFRDITERRRAVAAAQAEQARLEHQYQRQLALAGISLSGGETIEVAELFDRVVKAAQEQLPARGGAVILVFEQGNIALAASALPHAAREIGFDATTQLEHVANWITEHRDTFISSHVAHDDPFGVAEANDFVSAYAAVPLFDNDRVAGVLFALETEQTRHFTPDDLDFLDALATRAALALAKSRLYGELRAANQRLEKQNEELTVAKQRAEEASAAKSEFLAKVSHELRTPMNGVIGMTDYLLTTELSADQREGADTIRASADRLLDSINRVLDFSRLETGNYVARVETFSPREMVDVLVTDATRRIGGKPVRCSSEISASVPDELAGDAGGLQHALMRLVENAVKFTSHGEIVLGASVVHETERGIRLRFNVRDTGPGISAEAQSRLFRSFTQADGSSARHHEGLGLGLATAKQLVENLGGDIHVVSVVGEGSTFFVEVPLSKVLDAVNAR